MKTRCMESNNLLSDPRGWPVHIATFNVHITRASTPQLGVDRPERLKHNRLPFSLHFLIYFSKCAMPWFMTWDGNSDQRALSRRSLAPKRGNRDAYARLFHPWGPHWSH